MKPLSLVVLISGSGSNLQAIIDSIEDGRLNAQIKAVISNRPDAYGLQRAREHGIEAISLDHKAFSERVLFDQQLQQQIDLFQPDMIVLAGYMRILSEGFINHYWPNMINIHPSLLPKYQGLNTHQRALDNKDSLHGASIHVVTPELDSGPVILQGQFEIEEGDDASKLQQKTHRLEHQMYPQVLQWLAEKRLQFNQGVPEFDHAPLQQPILHKSH
jgi:phosphoribosylglycinamide formyltransferase 1